MARLKIVRFRVTDEELNLVFILAHLLQRSRSDAIRLVIRQSIENILSGVEACPIIETKKIGDKNE